MDKDLLELVSSLILQKEYLTEKVKKLEVRCNDLLNLNEVLANRVNTLERIVMNNQNDLHKIKSGSGLFPLTNIPIKNYSMDT